MAMFKKVPVIATYTGGTIEEDRLHLYGDSCLGIRGPSDTAWAIDTELNRQYLDDFAKMWGEKPATVSYGG